MKTIITTIALLIAVCLQTERAAARPVQVMLSFDTERNGDVAALRTLAVGVPATYFITGRFAEENRDFVAELSRGGNTIGSHSHSHPHLPALSPDELETEMRRAKQAIESITGKPVVWFRAPYMEYSEQVMQSLKKMGFIYDSSDQDRWQRQDVLYEVPVSSFMNGTMIASDYDLLYKHEATSAEFEGWLKALYREKSNLGQPVMILLHPGMAVKYPEALRAFVAFVLKEGGAFVSADTYMASVEAHKPQRYAVWVDFSTGSHNAELIAREVSGIGATDVFLMARDAQGNSYFGPESGEDLFGKTLALLKSRGMRVHAWIPALADASVLHQHPEWAMVSQNGTRSATWLSPSHPGVAAHAAATVRHLLKNYKLDGIHLDYLRYPDLNYDYSPVAVTRFAEENRIEGLPAVSELISSRYTTWTNWRSAEIAVFAGKIREQVKQAGGNVEFSAGLSGQAAVSYREAEAAGQDIAVLSRHLDLLVPVAIYAREGIDEDRIAHIALSIRGRAGEKPVLTKLMFEAKGRWSHERFSKALAGAASGSDGVGVDDYRLLAESSGSRMPAESLELLRKVFGGHTLSSIEPRASFGSIVMPRLPMMSALFALVLLFIMNFVAIPVFGKHHHHHHLHAQAGQPAVPVSGKTWQEIDAAIGDGSIDGPTAEKLAGMLHQYDARKVQQNRIVLVLDAIGRSTDPLPELYTFMHQSREWKALALKYFHEVCLLGYADIEDHAVKLTSSGRALLESAREGGFEREHWIFIEKRLHETVAVKCPHCGSENLTHFFWGSFECSGCGKKVQMGHARHVAVRDVEESSAYTGSIDFF